MYDKPLPVPTERTQPFWDGLKAHRLDIQQCEACHAWVFFPRHHCPNCFSQSLSWKTVSGQGELLTYTLSHLPTMPEFADDLPQKLAVVRLDEGPHINTTLVGVDVDQIKVGMRVKPVFDDVVPGEATLLRYTAA